MGIFDLFGDAKEPPLTPPVALAAGLIYAMASDGSIEDEERFMLGMVFGRHSQAIDRAISYVKNIAFETYLSEAATLLDEEQKVTLLLMMLDLMLADGEATQAEQKLFNQAVAAFSLDHEKFEPLARGIVLKNRKALFFS
ncbi:MAG: TerB family tellurite resistance protein [Campylobacterales bacterium]